MADVDEIRARVTELAESLGVAGEVHDLDGISSGDSAKRVEVIVINRRGELRRLQMASREFERAGVDLFDDFVKTAARELTKS